MGEKSMDIFKELERIDSFLGSPARSLMSLRPYPAIDVVQRKGNFQLSADVAGK